VNFSCIWKQIMEGHLGMEFMDKNKEKKGQIEAKRQDPG
jgi:hypothetical protein